ncbi:MAG: TIGR00282 family metallophosphoesterase [Vicinamibacterales bacterium]
MKLLFIGDIVARPGRDLVRSGLKALVAARDIDFVIANGENAAGGSGITREIAEDFFRTGVHVLTSGNHIWDKRETLEFITREPRLLRPANYPDGTPGEGSVVVPAPDGTPVGVVNVMGRVFLLNIDDPFGAARREIDRVRAAGARVIFVDVHAETTSEKIAMGWYLDGTCTAVVGTHTHVQTADERVLPGGTAYLTDVGMTGPHDGVIGVEKEAVLTRFTRALPARFEAATGDPRLNAVIIDADPDTGRATAIERVSLSAAELAALAGRSEPAVSNR